METLERAYRNGLYTFKGLFGFLKPEIYVLVKVVNPVFQVMFFSLIAKHAYGNVDITPFIVGNAFVLCMYNAFFGVGCTLINERGYGTLKLLIGSPCNKFNVFITKSTFHIIDGIFTVLIGLFTGIIFFNIRIPIDILPYFIVCLVIAIFTACSMGLLIGSIGLITRDINMLLNLSSMLLMSLCGVNFSIEKLPTVLQYVSNILPLTNALKASKLLLNGGIINYGKVNSLLINELLLGIGYCIIAYLSFKFMEKLAKCRATIDIY